MIELTVREYLSSKLSVPVLMERPKNEAEFVLIEKTGSDIENCIEYATLAIQSYSTSLFNAARLNEEVKHEMLHIIDTEDISRCDLNSDYNFTDEQTKNYRYQAVYDLVY